MEALKLSVPDQIKIALDGRSQRWLSFEVRIPEAELSQKMNGHIEFTEKDIKAINERLNATVTP